MVFPRHFSIRFLDILRCCRTRNSQYLIMIIRHWNFSRVPLRTQKTLRTRLPESEKTSSLRLPLPRPRTVLPLRSCTTRRTACSRPGQRLFFFNASPIVWQFRNCLISCRCLLYESNLAAKITLFFCPGIPNIGAVRPQRSRSYVISSVYRHNTLEHPLFQRPCKALGTSLRLF